MGENLYTPNCIRTNSGKYVNVFDPDPDTILIEDIAHALSQLPRFGGHLEHFYSVANHSIYCAMGVESEFKLEALLHDASEAYLLDMPKPIKVCMPEYQKVEKRLQEVICDKFDLPFPISKEVKEMDKIALESEWEYLMLGELSVGLSIKETKKQFLNNYKFLTNGN